MLEGSKSFNDGRNGELLAAWMFRREGFATIDIAAAAAKGAPLLKTWEATIISPDGLMARRATFLYEIKSKRRAGKSDGGPREVEWVPKGQKFHCIERRQFLHYQRAQRSYGRPLILVVICMDDARLIAAPLDRLGEPYPSLQPEEMDVVNFPEERFSILWSFDPARLRRYFDEPPDVKNDRRMRLYLDWLCPRQQEFALFRSDLVNRLEDRWAA